jgi:hypothetical protein
VLQATICDGGKLDAFAFGEDRLRSAKVDAGRRDGFDTLMIADVIVVFDEGGDLPFKIARQVAVLEKNADLQDLVLALDLSLGLRVILTPTRSSAATVKSRANPQKLLGLSTCFGTNCAVPSSLTNGMVKPAARAKVSPSPRSISQSLPRYRASTRPRSSRSPQKQRPIVLSPN